MAEKFQIRTNWLFEDVLTIAAQIGYLVELSVVVQDKTRKRTTTVFTSCGHWRTKLLDLIQSLPDTTAKPALGRPPRIVQLFYEPTVGDITRCLAALGYAATFKLNEKIATGLPWKNLSEIDLTDMEPVPALVELLDSDLLTLDIADLDLPDFELPDFFDPEFEPPDSKAS
jgi:hypothetical protein